MLLQSDTDKLYNNVQHYNALLYIKEHFFTYKKEYFYCFHRVDFDGNAALTHRKYCITTEQRIEILFKLY